MVCAWFKLLGGIGDDVGVGRWSKFTNHMPCGCNLVLVRTTSLFLMIETLFGVKRTLQLLSQNCTTETKVRSCNSGKRYVLRADNGNQGRSSSAVCVE